MNLLYIVRQNTYTTFGGDTVQFSKTKQYLEKKFNISIIIKGCGEIKDTDIDNADLVHIWGINASSDLDQIILQIKKRNKKIIISSIYWNTSHSVFLKYFISWAFNYKTFPYLEKINNIFNKDIIVPICKLIPKFKTKMCYIWGSREYNEFRKKSIDSADYIIPNSDEEGLLLCSDINLDYQDVQNKFISIPNAVDISILQKDCTEQILPELNNFVIEAAGIEPLKNQLGVVRALFKDKNIPIVFAGAIRDEKYYKVLKNLADKRGNVYFTGRIQETQLFDLYKRAFLHVLPSFRESPGLVTIEALMNNCQIVVSNEKFCPIKYYQFDKYGFVCNPYDTKSIRTAILNAYKNPKNINLTKDYYKFFSYENVADMTYEIYKKVLEG